MCHVYSKKVSGMTVTESSIHVYNYNIIYLALTPGYPLGEGRPGIYCLLCMYRVFRILSSKIRSMEGSHLLSSKVNIYGTIILHV